jgi:hypothetical protein
MQVLLSAICGVFTSRKIIDNISISAKIGVNPGVPEFGTMSKLLDG